MDVESKNTAKIFSTSSQFVQFAHGRTTIDVRYGNYKYFPPFNPLIFRLACLNSIASRAQHYSVPSITRNKSRRKFYHIEGGNYCSKSSPRIFCTFMEHPVHDACLDRVFSFVFTSRKVGSPPPLSLLLEKFPRFRRQNRFSPSRLEDFLYCVCGQRTGPDQTGKFCAPFALWDSSILFGRLNVVFHGSDNRGRVETMRGWNSLLACFVRNFFFKKRKKEKGNWKGSSRELFEASVKMCVFENVCIFVCSFLNIGFFFVFAIFSYSRDISLGFY